METRLDMVGDVNKLIDDSGTRGVWGRRWGRILTLLALVVGGWRGLDNALEDIWRETWSMT